MQTTSRGSNAPREPGRSDLSSHELRFQSLFHEGRALSFPCDGDGHVDLDALSERARANYLLARHQIGREYANPEVRRLAETAH